VISALTRRTDSWTFRYFACSPPGRFAPLDVLIPGRFSTSLGVLLPDDKEVLTVLQIKNFQICVETSREAAKRPGIETYKGAKRRGGEQAKYRNVHESTRELKTAVI